MRYRHLKTEELSKAINILEVVFWLVVSLFTALWWLPEYFGEEYPLTKRDGIMFLCLLWVYFLNPITRYGFTRFSTERGSFIPLKVRSLLISLSTIGFLIGLVL